MRVICETDRLIVREWTDSLQDVDRAFDTYRREEVAGSVLLLPMPEPSDGSEAADEVEIGWREDRS